MAIDSSRLSYLLTVNSSTAIAESRAKLWLLSTHENRREWLLVAAPSLRHQTVAQKSSQEPRTRSELTRQLIVLGRD